ncbi:MAG: TGS domain-containing protein, partial [Clostridia bacterium]|nr:TGS domain-containing protein [Clostridia bacterium]
MELTLKDGSKLSLAGAMSAYEAAKQISEGLARAAIVCKIDGQLASMDTLIDKDCS